MAGLWFQKALSLSCAQPDRFYPKMLNVAHVLKRLAEQEPIGVRRRRNVLGRNHHKQRADLQILAAAECWWE